jgi:hypothetical protein
MNICDFKTAQVAAIARAEKAKRDLLIVDSYKLNGTITGTCKSFNYAYSRDTVRKALTKAGVYEKTAREKKLIARFRTSPLKSKWDDRTYSKSHGSELQMQTEAEQMLKDSAVQHQRHIQREVQVPGCQMRADLAGYNWAIETKKECSSQGMLTAMAQCLVYRKHLNKRYVCIMLPDDIEPADFYVSECLSYGIPVIKMSQLIWWINTVQNDAQPN